MRQRHHPAALRRHPSLPARRPALPTQHGGYLRTPNPAAAEARPHVARPRWLPAVPAAPESLLAAPHAACTRPRALSPRSPRPSLQLCTRLARVHLSANERENAFPDGQSELRMWTTNHRCRKARRIPPPPPGSSARSAACWGRGGAAGAALTEAASWRALPVCCRTAWRSRAADGRCGTSLPLPAPRTVTHHLSSSGFLAAPLPSPIPKAAPRHPVMQQKAAAGPGRASGSLAPRLDVPSLPACRGRVELPRPPPCSRSVPLPSGGRSAQRLGSGAGGWAERGRGEAGSARSGGRHLDGAAGAGPAAARRNGGRGAVAPRAAAAPGGKRGLWWFPHCKRKLREGFSLKRWIIKTNLLRYTRRYGDITN